MDLTRDYSIKLDESIDATRHSDKTYFLLPNSEKEENEKLIKILNPSNCEINLKKNPINLISQSQLLLEVKSTINNTINEAARLADHFSTEINTQTDLDKSIIYNSQENKLKNNLKTIDNRLKDPLLSPKKINTNNNEELSTNHSDLNQSNQNLSNKTKLDKKGDDEVDFATSKYFKKPKLTPENESTNKSLAKDITECSKSSQINEINASNKTPIKHKASKIPNQVGWERLKSEDGYFMSHSADFSTKKSKKKSPKLNNNRKSAIRTPTNLSPAAKLINQRSTKINNKITLNNDLKKSSLPETSTSYNPSSSFSTKSTAKNTSIKENLKLPQNLNLKSFIKDQLYLDTKVMRIVDEELKNELKIVDETVKNKIRNNITKRVGLICNKAINDVFRTLFDKAKFELNERQAEINDSNYDKLNLSSIFDNNDFLNSSLIDNNEIVCSSFVRHGNERKTLTKQIKKNDALKNKQDQKLASKQSLVKKPFVIKTFDGILTTIKKNGEIVKERLSTGEIIEITRPEDTKDKKTAESKIDKSGNDNVIDQNKNKKVSD